MVYPQVKPSPRVSRTRHQPPAGYPIIVEICEETICFYLATALDQSLVEIATGCEGLYYSGGVDEGLDPEVGSVVNVEVEGDNQGCPYHYRPEAGDDQNCIAL